MAKLREHTGTAARALEFVVLTTTRVNESSLLNASRELLAGQAGQPATT